MPLLSEYLLIVERLKAARDIMNETCDVITDTSEALPAFCQSLETILRQGLKKGLGSIGLADRDYWNVIKDLTTSKRVSKRPPPSISHVITLVQQCKKVTTSLSRGRLFLRIALSKGVLAQAVQCLLDNQEFVRYWYKDHAILIDHNEKGVIVDILKSLKKKTYKFNVDNCSFLDETWLLPDVRHLEFVPCAMLGLTLFTVSNKCMIIDVQSKSVAEEKGIEPGDCLDELFGEIIDEKAALRIGAIRKKNQGKPVVIKIVKGRYEDDRWFPPLYKRYLSLCQAGKCEMIQRNKNNQQNTELDDESQPVRNQFMITYQGSTEVGAKGNCSYVQDGIKKLMKHSEQIKSVEYKLQLLERDISLTNTETSEVVRYSYTETSSCALHDDDLRRFGFITGNTTCSFADSFQCHIFLCESVQLARSIIDGIGKGFDRTVYCV